MKFSLEKQQVFELAECNWECERVGNLDDTNLFSLLDGAQNWTFEIVCHTYFVSQLIERKIKENIDPLPYLEKIYSLPDVMWLSLQELDQDFVNILFLQDRKRDLTLDDNIISIQDQLNNHQYGN